MDINRFFQQFSRGVGLVCSSFGFVAPWVYVAVFVIALLFGGASVGISSMLADFFTMSVNVWLSGLVAQYSWLEGFVVPVGWMVSAISWLVSLALLALVSGSVILVILSPLLTHVADKAWERCGGIVPRQSVWDVVKSICRGIVVAVKYCFLQIFLLAVVFVLGFVPVLGVVAPFLGVAINAFFYGASLADYAAERAGVTSRTAFSFVNANRGLMVGLGLPFAILLFIPFLGKFLGLFLAPVIAAAGSRALAEKGIE